MNGLNQMVREKAFSFFCVCFTNSIFRKGFCTTKKITTGRGSLARCVTGGDLSFSCEQFHDPLETLTRCRDGRLTA